MIVLDEVCHWPELTVARFWDAVADFIWHDACPLDHHERGEGEAMMALEVRFSINGHSIGTMVVSRTYPDVPLPDGEGIGSYTATLQMNAHPESATVDGVRHVRADGAVKLVQRVLNALFKQEEQQ